MQNVGIKRMSQMRVFYIDYENVMDSGLNGIGKLTASDMVKIFYSEDAQRMSFGTHRRIIESKAVFTYHKISPELKTVKNAVDILILQDLETTMKNDKSSEYFVVSKDNDYDGFIDEKLRKKYKIKRISEVCQATATKEINTVSKNNSPNSGVKTTSGNSDKRKQKEQRIRCHIGQYLREYKEWKEDIVEAYMESSSRQELNNKLQQSFENEDVSEILAALRPLTKDMPGK